MYAALRVAAELIAIAIAPPRCSACDVSVRALRVFCPSCSATVEVAEECSGGVAAFGYGGALARAIVRLKYEARPDLARPLGDLLAQAAEASAPNGGVVVIPVPLHPQRLAERGYNQAQLLASRVARRLGAPLLPLALLRTRATAQQATLDRASRAANLAGVFAVRRRHDLRGQRILLVDDVRTTGATLQACAQALALAGAAEVRWAVVAQTPSGNVGGLS